MLVRYSLLLSSTELITLLLLHTDVPFSLVRISNAAGETAPAAAVCYSNQSVVTVIIIFKARSIITTSLAFLFKKPPSSFFEVCCSMHNEGLSRPIQHVHMTEEIRKDTCFRVA